MVTVDRLVTGYGFTTWSSVSSQLWNLAYCSWPGLSFNQSMRSVMELGSPQVAQQTLPANAEDAGSILGSGRSPGGGNGNPLQAFCLENPRDRGTWQATVHGVAKSQTRLSDWAHMHELGLRDVETSEVRISCWKKVDSLLLLTSCLAHSRLLREGLRNWSKWGWMCYPKEPEERRLFRESWGLDKSIPK